VVIGIVALLISILSPALGSVRRQARTTQCASNMRQLATGWMLYANANKGISLPGRMPMLGGGSTNLYAVGKGEVFRPRWFVTMGAASGFIAYNLPPDVLAAEANTKLVDNPVFLCPEEADRVNNRNYTYGYNFQFLGNSRNKVGTPAGTFKPINFPVKISKVKGSNTILFADGMGTAAGKPKSVRTAYRVDGSGDVNAIGNHAWSLDPPRLLSANSEYCDDNNRSDPHRSAPDPRHKDKANVAHCDGHVKALTRQEMGYVVNADDSVAPRGTGAVNNRFSPNSQDADPPAIN